MNKRTALLSALVLTLLLSGCGARTMEEMYALPKRSREYSRLQAAIDAAMEGLTYSAPRSGENQQSVQTADLDGDGKQEYLVFARGGAERPLQVLVLKEAYDGSIYVMDTIGSNGTSFEQVEYIDFDGSPGAELVIGQQVSDQILRSVAVYSFARGQAELLLLNGYSRYITGDLNGDGCGQLLVLRPGNSQTQGGVAVLYGFREGQTVRSGDMALSVETEQIRRIVLGSLQDGGQAVYVTGNDGEGALLTDIFTVSEGRFVNLAAEGKLSTSFRPTGTNTVYPQDINEDGILEIPAQVTVKPVSQDQELLPRPLLRWFSPDRSGLVTDKCCTFHNFAESWYLLLDGSWAGRVSVEQDRTRSLYRFYVWDDGYREATELFDVSVHTGANRDKDARQEGRFVLYRGEEVTYAAALAEGAPQHQITQDSMTRAFRLIHQDWKNADN